MNRGGVGLRSDAIDREKDLPIHVTTVVIDPPEPFLRSNRSLKRQRPKIRLAKLTLRFMTITSKAKDDKDGRRFKQS